MKFNPEAPDQYANNFGPHCRNCHNGASGCEWCHDVNGVTPTGAKTTSYTEYAAATTDSVIAAVDTTIKSYYDPKESWTVDRYVEWPTDWDTTQASVSYACADNGFYWPHRTMGYMMLKDQLFGLDFDGTPVAVGEVRDGSGDFDGDGTPDWKEPYWRNNNNTTPTFWGQPAHDLDSVCLDCHNPTIWNATAYNDYVDNPADPNDNYDNELILRGLP
jgi:hypothetical protein